MLAKTKVQNVGTGKRAVNGNLMERVEFYVLGQCPALKGQCLLDIKGRIALAL